MKNQFVTYEIALKLKELGFDEKCLKLWEHTDFYTVLVNPEEFKKVVSEKYCNAPLWQQVIDWFLNQYNIWIIVDTSLIKFYKNDELQPSKFQFVIEDLNNRDADYMFHSADEELFYFDYKHAREQAILKAIELCHK